MTNYEKAHREWLKSIKEVKDTVTTPEGIRDALIMLREEASQVHRDDWTTREILNDTIAFFEAKLRSLN